MRQLTCKAFFLTLDQLKTRNIKLYKKEKKEEKIDCILKKTFYCSGYGRSRSAN